MTPAFLGNMDLLQQRKVAFFCSRNYAPKAVLASYDWATAQRDSVIISTFHSPLEKDVLHFLLKNRQPVIYVLPARMYKRVPSYLQKALEEGLLLLISFQSDSVRMYSQTNANQAIRYVLDTADEIVFGYIAPDSNNARLSQSLREEQTKPVSILVE